MLKIITTKRLKLLEADLAYATAEVARLKKVRPIADALTRRGISVDDLLPALSIYAGIPRGGQHEVHNF